jgi:CCR4-NOT transcription complex subunit 9
LHESNVIPLGHYPILLYPFLRASQKDRSYEQIRLGCLSVIEALLQQHDSIETLTGPNDGTRMISFFLTTELVPLLLQVMEDGVEASKTAATAALLKILLDETGLTYICHTQERQEAVMGPLAILVEDVVQKQSIRLLKLVLQCYARLTDDRRYGEKPS